MKRTGLKAHVFFDSFDEERIITGGATSTTQPGAWYFIIERGEGSSLPYQGGVLKSPSAPGAEQITLVEGDKLFPLDPQRICKTSASVSAEEGSIDVGDDCDPGATILDGNVKISGSLAGFFRYDDQTQEFNSVTADMLNRFFDIVDDDGAGIYEEHPRENGAAYLLINLNSDIKAGQTENWLFVPAIISSVSVNLGNTDVQNKDLSWSKGEGKAVIYRVPRAA